MKTLLITGACGFLGSEIVCQAQEAGWAVRAFDCTLRVLPPGIQGIAADISDMVALREALEGCDAVIHAAGLAHVFGRQATDASRFQSVNEVGTARVIEAAVATGIRRIVHVSSVSVYGSHTDGMCAESHPCDPVGAYAVSKWNAERRAMECVGRSDVSLKILRFATMYGDGDRGNVAQLIVALRRGRFVWPGLGLNKKSLIHKVDAARACLRALEKDGERVEIYNVSSPPVSLQEIVSAICSAMGKPVPRMRIPASLIGASRILALIPGKPRSLYESIAKITRDDAYDASLFNSIYDFQTLVSLDEGMRSAVASL
jgi:nucleoside-diphosphate-sugar epimerase